MKLNYTLILTAGILMSLIILISGCTNDDSLYRKATDNYDMKYCYQMKDSSNLDECVASIADFTRNKSACGLIKYVPDKDRCYLLMSYYNNVSDWNQSIIDLDLCPKIEDKWVRNTCYNQIAIFQNNSELCSEMYYNVEENLYDDIDECYTTIAINTQNPKICSKISEKNKEFESSHIQACQAVAERNSEKCFRISLIGPRDVCIYRLAIIMLNSSLCDRMSGTSDSYTLEGCQRTIADRNYTDMN
jgi:hypothetical protein